MTDQTSRVEQIWAESSGQKLQHAPTEKLRTLVVEQFPELGKLTALRFLEWAQQNPGWSVALPTGKTPEHFIKWTSHILQNWERAHVVQLLEQNGLDPASRPDLSSLHFVQIDEFYPIDASWNNSFYYYVNRFYLDGFGFDKAKALLINPNQIGLGSGESLSDVWGNGGVDLSLRTRIARNPREERQQRLLTEVDEFCYGYERKIRSLGGIGFFLGGIGPDGHIGFNVRGSDHYSTTRLCDTNYETQAAAASDLGGIEVAANRQVITIGLGTITYNKESTAIIIAAGEAKAPIVKAAIQSPAHNSVPASVLQNLPHACFYVTRGAAKQLTERAHQVFAARDGLDVETAHQMVVDAALASGQRPQQLASRDFDRLRSGPLFLEKLQSPLNEVLQDTKEILEGKVAMGLDTPSHEVFLHTAPHHDDIMLGYLPYLLSFCHDASNRHIFNYLTSGFNAVTNAFMLTRCLWARRVLAEQGEAIKNYMAADGMAAAAGELDGFLNGLARRDEGMKEQAVGLRMLRCLGEIYSEASHDLLIARLQQLSTYFETTYPGKKDVPEVQKLKGMMREWEAEVLWAHLGFAPTDVVHSRLGFYKGDIFTEEPEINRDVLPLLALLEKTNPTVVTVALDPEGSGPDTHFKVLQAVAAALKLYREKTGRNNIRVWGYRNVWYRFSPAVADLIAPISLGQMAAADRIFLDSFASQKEASFPSYEYQGPFSELASKIQVEQYQQMCTLLGSEWFANHEDRRIRGARGMVYLKVMDLDAFLARSRELKQSMERN